MIPDGIALYRGTDGPDLGTAIPAHGTATITETDPTACERLRFVQLRRSVLGRHARQAAGLARVDCGTAVDERCAAATCCAARSNGRRHRSASRALLDGAPARVGGSLDLRAVAASGLGTNATGFATTLVAPVRTVHGGAISMVRSVNERARERQYRGALAAIGTPHLRTARGSAPAASSYTARASSTTSARSCRALPDAVHLSHRSPWSGRREFGITRHHVERCCRSSPSPAPLAGGISRARRQRRRAAVGTALPIYPVPNGTASSQSQLLDAGIGLITAAACASTRWCSAKPSRRRRTEPRAAAASRRCGDRAVGRAALVGAVFDHERQQHQPLQRAVHLYSSVYATKRRPRRASTATSPG